MPVDPLAAERLRTILTDAIDPRGGSGAVDNPAATASAILDAFPDAHFEYRTNEHGVRVRRIVAEGVWEVDPNAVPVGDSPNVAEMREMARQGVLCSCQYRTPTRTRVDPACKFHGTACRV